MLRNTSAVLSRNVHCAIRVVFGLDQMGWSVSDCERHERLRAPGRHLRIGEDRELPFRLMAAMTHHFSRKLALGRKLIEAGHSAVVITIHVDRHQYSSSTGFHVSTSSARAMKSSSVSGVFSLSSKRMSPVHAADANSAGSQRVAQETWTMSSMVASK